MARYSSGDMTKPKMPGKITAQQSSPAKKAASGQQTLRVPAGGQVTIRKVSNGVLATVTTADWREEKQVFADQASDLQIE